MLEERIIKMKIAVIGSGISGLSAAYLLSQHHDVTLFEKNNYLGGHTRTVVVQPEPGVEIPVDTGFIVFNYRNYPLLAQLFAELEVPVHKSDMSFGLTADNGWLEYGTPKPWNMFAQKRNLFRPAYWRMMRDVLRFFRQAPNYMNCGASTLDDKTRGLTLGECLEEMQLGEWFQRYFLLPMGAAIWSCPTSTILDFPAENFLRFFRNHGLLSATGQPQWYTVTGGAREYVSRLTARYTKTFEGKIVRHGAARVERSATGVFITAENGARYAAEKVVFACHADQALALIDNPTDEERDVLAAFKFGTNRTYLHGDVSFMPKRRGAWCSWTYLLEQREAQADGSEPHITMSYWMNRLQSLDVKYPLIETLNPARQPDPALVYDSFEFEHPILDQAAVSAQARISAIQGTRNTWYCGAWQRNGFHEDGLWSALRVASDLDAAPAWDGVEALTAVPHP